MIKPMCKLCGVRHYGLCAPPVPIPAPIKPVLSAPPVDPALSAPPPVRKTRAPNGTFDRTAYQRELMRKRRAAQKKIKEVEQ